MENLNTKENDEDFNFVIQYKDESATNLAEKFDSYGLDRLESKVPIVNDCVVERLNVVEPEQQCYMYMSLTSQAAQKAIAGRVPRTRNKVIKLVSVGDKTLLSTGETRERSPVDENELDAEIEEYMREKAKRKAEEEAAKNQGLPTVEASTSNTVVSRRVITKNENLDDPTEDDLDKEMDEYMQRAMELRKQKNILNVHSEGGRALERMELDFDNDRLDDYLTDSDEEF